MARSTVWWGGLTVIVSLAIARQTALADESGRGGSAKCGGPGLPACPLQSWMRRSVSAPLASNNGGALAVALERVAADKPDADWLSWEQYALEGAAAAKRGDLRAARVACTGCHASYRELYRTKYRERAMPSVIR